MSAPFDHLESPLYAEPLFYIEPRDKDLRPEIDRQAEFKAMARRAGLKPAAVPNARKWGQKAKNNAVKEGVVWGYPDLIVTGRNRFTAFIEFKNGTEKPDQHQIDCLNDLYMQGFPVGVFRTAQRALAWLKDQGAPLV